MNRLVEELLNLSRISRQDVKREKFDMSALAASIFSEFQETDRGRKVDIFIQRDLSSRADPDLMKIVLTNLLGNAWKFTSKIEKARIEFGAFESDGETVYYVKDNGAGFDSENKEKIFLPFHRLHTDQEFEGTGIGLSIVERIIFKHGGRVWIEGEVGKGAVVYFTLNEEL
jgi:signal transduction histidine kinase